MNMKFIAAAALVVAFAMPAFAANEFYLVQDTASKKCSIVEEAHDGHDEGRRPCSQDEDRSRNRNEGGQELRPRSQ